MCMCVCVREVEGGGESARTWFAAAPSGNRPRVGGAAPRVRTQSPRSIACPGCATHTTHTHKRTNPYHHHRLTLLKQAASASRTFRSRGSELRRTKEEDTALSPARAMQSLLAELRRALAAVWHRVLELLQSLFGVASGRGGAGPSAGGGASWTTGVQGLAALLVAVHHLRGSGGSGGGGRASTSGGAAAAGGRGGASTSAAGRGKPPPGGKAPASSGSRSGAAAAAAALASPLAPAVRSRLPGVRRVCISVPGVLLVERSAARLSETGRARVRPGAAALVRAMASAVGAFSGGGGAIYLLAHVADDVGQAVVAGALEAAGVVGGATSGGSGGSSSSSSSAAAVGAAAAPARAATAAPVPLHRLLFVSTLDGKASVVRQLEPCLHVDAHAATVEALQRFMPRLVLVAPGAAAVAGASGSGGGGEGGGEEQEKDEDGDDQGSDAPVLAAARAYAASGPPANVTVAPSLARYLGLSQEAVAAVAAAGVA